MKTLFNCLSKQRLESLRKQLILFTLLGYSSSLWAQQVIMLDDMRQRYAAFLRQEVDTTISYKNDEIVKSTYHCYENKGERYKNPRIENPTSYIYMLTDRLRTPEYPGERHYWSLVDYERVNHRTFKRPIRPIERRRLKYMDKSFVRYLALDSIEGMRRADWPKAFAKKYAKRKHKFHYAKGVSDQVVLLRDVRNMMGYTVSPTFWDVEVRRGRVVNSDHLGERCEEQMGDLMYLGPLPALDGNTTRQQRINLRLRALADSINRRVKVLNPPKEKQRFDLLIIHQPDRRVDVELLWTDGEEKEAFMQIREALRQLPPKFFVRYWTSDGQPLPGGYLRGTLYKNGTWGFTMAPFFSSFVGQIL